MDGFIASGIPFPSDLPKEPIALGASGWGPNPSNPTLGSHPPPPPNNERTAVETNINTSPTPRSMAVQSKRQVGGCASAGSIVLLLQR